MSTKTLPCGRPVSRQPIIVDKARLKEYEQILRDYLRKKGLKWTRQRWSMAKHILRTADHMNAQEIVERVRKVDTRIGVATIYRNIKVLCESGILAITHHGIDGESRYEIQEKGHHAHIICLDCGEILEFQDNRIDELQKNISKSLGFKFEDHRNVVHGHCNFLKKSKTS